ncbi:MAG: cell division protein FtsA [Muribaculaceae bacterium]|nr:cell division protein FtsA [Muribaculaceae bacterium]
MATDRYIAALEISSSKVIGAVGAVGKSGQLEILAVEQEKSSDSVRYGHIQNIEETSTLINRVLDRLERRPNIAPREVTGVYVGISGRSLRNIEKEVSMNLPDDTVITDSILDRLKSMAMEAEIDNSLAVVDAVPRIFTVGRNETHRPKGQMGNHISAIYDLIVARPEMTNKLKKVVSDKLGLDIKGIVVTPIATADIALNEHEKKIGCMLVDIGAETTSVTIYTRGNLVYYATLPFGGRNITLDLKALNVIEDKAEELKVTFGHALSPSVPSQETISGIPLSKISNYVVARAEEIVANIAEQLRYAGMTDKDIPEGIVVCGGGARLNGMTDLISKFTGMKVRIASYPDFIRLSDINGQGMESLQVSAIMYEATKRPDDDCLQIPAPPEPTAEGSGSDIPEPEPEPEEPKKKRKKGGFFKKIGETLGRAFTPIGEDDEGDELYS